VTAINQQGLPATTGIVLAGGGSRRMGSDKSLLPLDGERFIERICRVLAGLFPEVLIVTNSPERYASIPCRKVPDLHRDGGVLAGLHAGLFHARHPRIFAVACDMPFLQPELIRHLCRSGRGDVHVPRTAGGLEPLHACYRKSCLPAMEEALLRGDRRIVAFFPEVRVVEMPPAVWRRYDPEGVSFFNVNTPQDYFALRQLRPAGGNGGVIER